MDLPSAAAAALAAAAENDDALAAAHAGPSPTGRLLVPPGAGAHQRGEDAEVLDVDALLPGEQAHELKVAPVVGVRTPLAQTHDRRIAVSSRYVCYGLPQGIVRALDRRSGGRALFRGHAQPIADAAFFRNEEDNDDDDSTPQLLATASIGGDVIVRSVSTPSAADEAAPEDSVLLRATAPCGSSTASPPPPPRLAWHPTEPRVLAVAGGDRVALLVVPEPGNATDADAVVDASSGASLVLPLPAESAGAAVTALAFAPGGQALAAADSAGYVTCWRLDGGASDDAPSARWRPFSDAAAAADGADPAPGALLWLDGSGSLLTGDGRNRVLRLWHVDSSASQQQPPRLLQTVELRASAASSSSSSAFFNQAALNRRLGLVVLANAANPGAGTAAQGAVATLHYRLGAGGSSTPAALDYLALFSTRHPCMSVAAAAETASDDAAGGPPRPALLLWAVQPEAVQRYALEPALARPPPGAVAEAAAVAAKPSASVAAPPPPPPPPAAPVAAAADEDDDEEQEETRPAPLTPPRAPQVPEVPASSGILAAAHHHHQHNLAASAPVVSAAATTNGQQPPRPARSSAPGGGAVSTPAPAPATATTTLDASAVASAVQAQVAAANAELLSEVRGELARALRALEVGVSAKLEAKMEAQLKAAQRRAEDDEKKRAASAKKASADAERALAAAVTKAASDAAQAQLRLVPQALAQALPQALAQADVSPGVAAALEPALRSALRDAFSATVVPAYERATQAMFGQIESALRNWAQHGQQQQHQALQQFLQQQQQQQRGPPPPQPMMVGGPPPMGGPPLPMGGPPPPPHMAPPPPPPPPDPRVALQALLASGQIESAFAQALSLASLEAVVWLCRQAGPAAQVAGREPCPLSQVVLLSLTQQLAADLRADADAALKLDWLSECAPLLQPRDPSVAPHLRGALAPAVPGLRALAAGGQGIDPALAKRAKTVVHLFNSLMHQ